MKTLIASALLLASSAAYAHDASFSANSCDVDLNGGIKISSNEIAFSKNKTVIYRIVDDESLFVDGKEISLTAQQQALVADYSTRIRKVVPEVKEIAVDAIDLAIDGVNLAFDELLGEGNTVTADLTEQLTFIRDEVNSEFAQGNTFYVDEDGFAGEEFFGEEFEAKIEDAVENTIQNSIGSLMIAVGQQMLMSGGSMDAFEARMERFGEQIEHEMEARGSEIEQRGEALCHSVAAIDELEDKLQQQIEPLADVNILTSEIKKNRHNI